MFWQANPAEKSVFRLSLKDTILAEFAFINKEYGIGKITESAVKSNQVFVFKAQESANFKDFKIYNAETKQPLAEIKFDASRNGKIELSDSKSFVWEQTAWTSFDRAWKNADGENLATFELNNPKIAENFVALKMSENAAKIGQIFLLILLGWALIVKEKGANGTTLLAEGNPQEFLAEDKIKQIFGIDLTTEKISKLFIAPVVLASAAVIESSESLIDAEDVAEVGIDVLFSFLDW